MACGILNLSECIVDNFGSFMASAINAPLKPLLDAIKFLITQPASVDTFYGLWQVLVYVISTMYGLFIMGAGFNFIISGYSVEKREHAKEWLQNTVLMIFCVQSSFLVYSALAEISSGLTSGIINMIDPNFFLITLDNPGTLGVQLFFGGSYLLVLLISVLGFSIIYILASMGVVFAPIGAFFYFIPSLKDIGRFIISLFSFILFLPFFSSLILLGSSVLLKNQGLSGVQVIFASASFALVNILLLLLAVLAIVRSVMSVMNSSVARGLLFIKGNFLAGLAPKKEKPPTQSREYWGKARYDIPRSDEGYRR